MTASPKPCRKLLSAAVHGTLSSGSNRCDGLCILPWPLHGVARTSVIMTLDRHGLVRITEWLRGPEVGVITGAGRDAFRRGYIEEPRP